VTNVALLDFLARSESNPFTCRTRFANPDVSMVASLNTYEQADALLDALREAPVGTPGALFTQNRTKEWMESCVIRAVKKLQAAEYHRANIDSEIQELHKQAEAARDKRHSGSVHSEQQAIAFELDAFLAAARSCIDFISGMLALHWGMDHKTSIQDLLKKANKDSTAPFSDLLRRWRDWILLVREYRDQCVHYRTLDLTGGYQVESQGENVVARVPSHGDRRACFDYRAHHQK
jgi:hypothetical protein